jgi:hypothetical protein
MSKRGDVPQTWSDFVKRYEFVLIYIAVVVTALLIIALVGR